MKSRLFIDTNVMLDFLGERYPFYESVARLATQADKGVLNLVVSPISFATVIIYFQNLNHPKLLRKNLGNLKF